MEYWPSDEEKFLGFEAKRWGICIGWFQMIMGCVSLVIGVTGMFNDRLLAPYLHAIIGTEADLQMNEMNIEFGGKLTSVQIFCIVLICGSLLSLFVAILLVIGIKENSARKVRIWWFFQTLCVILAIIQLINGFLLGTFKYNGASLAGHIVGIFIGYFFCWVVKIHLDYLESHWPDMSAMLDDSMSSMDQVWFFYRQKCYE